MSGQVVADFAGYQIVAGSRLVEAGTGQSLKLCEGILSNGR